MDKSKWFSGMEMDIKIQIGSIIINILNISYEPPRPSWYYKNHAHSGFELHFIPEGKGTLRVLDKAYVITPGVFYVTGPDVYHEQKADEIEPMSEYCINLEVKHLKGSKKKIDNYMQSEVDNIYNTLVNTKFWFGNDEYFSIDLFTKLIGEIESNFLGHYTYIQTLATQIILNVVRTLSMNKKSGYEVPHKIINDSRRLLVDDYFRNYEVSLSPHELASQIGVTVRQLNRIMQEYYEMSFKEKLTYERLEEAKNLLINSQLPLKEISEKIGFTSLSYFSRVFSKYYDISPNKFRSIHQA
jgi:AraC-like DNA-binding protein